MEVVAKDRSNKLTNSIMHFYGQQSLTDGKENLIRLCTADLKRCIALKYEKFELVPYGSSVSNFGSIVSDIDFTLNIFNEEIETKEQKIELLKVIAKLVSKAQLTCFITVVEAKIPIIKLRWRSLDVDISFNNSAAVENTDLLRRYSEIDKRVSVLGFWIKKWAREFDINSKAKGTICSYGYIIMLVHFLQRSDPQVLPCLHTEFLSGEQKDICIMNEQNVAQLFHDFLQFYANFNFSDHEIQIHTPTRVSVKRPEWKSSMVIVDPISPDVNVAGPVRRNVRKTIVDIFKKSADDMKAAFAGKNMENATMKKLFNLQ